MRKMIGIIALLLLAVVVSFKADAQSAHPLVQPHWTFVDETGSPCANCKLFSYLAGTTTPTPTYTDSTGTVQNTNPIILDASGSANVWVGSLKIKLVLEHPDNSLIWTVDNILTWTNGGGSGCSVAGLAGYFLVTDGAGGCTTTQITVNGTPLAAPSPINFLDSSTVHFTNPSVGTITATAAPPVNFQYQLNDTPLTGKFDPNTTNPAILDFNSTTPAAPAGNSNVTWQTDSTTGRISGYVPSGVQLEMVTTPPVGGQYVIVRPTSCSASDSNGRTLSACANGAGVSNSGTIQLGIQSGTFPPALGTLTMSGFALPAYVNPANVTAVYLGSTAGGAGDTVGAHVGSCGIYLSQSVGRMTVQATPVLTGYTGTDIPSISCGSSVNDSLGSPHGGVLTVADLFLIVYYTGTAPPVDTATKISPPLIYLSYNNTLEIDPLFPEQLSPTVVSLLPTASVFKGFVLPVLDGSSATDCTSGGGTTTVVCQSNGSGWAALGTGGSSLTLTTTGTSGAATYSSGTLNIPQYQGALTLTTIGTSGPATLLGTTLNIPQYTGGGGGGVGGSGTTGFYALWASASTLGNGSLDDGITLANWDTFSKPVQVACSGCATQISQTYNSGHAPSVGSATTAVLAPDASGNLDISEAGAAFDRVCTHSNGQCTGGGGSSYTNVNGSGSQTTVSALNTLCASGTIYATTPLSIATGGTVGCPVQFSKAGLWAIASGQTVTFTYPITETDNPSKIFAGSGNAVLPQQIAYTAWWGDVGDGTTDDTAAIQACATSLTGGGTCTIGTGSHKLSSAISVTVSNVGFAGQTPSFYSPSNNSTTGYPVIIFQSTASADAFDFTGTSTTAMLSNNSLKHLTITHSGVPSGTSTGVSMSFTVAMQAEDVTIHDYIRGVYKKWSDFDGNGGTKNLTIAWGFNGVTGYTGGTNVYGIYEDPAAGGNVSSSDWNVACATNNLSAITSSCIYAPSLAADLFLYNISAYEMSYGVNLRGGGQDVHCYDCVFDTNFVSGAYVGTGGNSVQFHGGWATNANIVAAPYVFDLESSSGVEVSSVLIYPQAHMQAGVYCHNCTGSTIGPLTFANTGVGGTMVTFDGASAGGNTLVGTLSGGNAVGTVIAYFTNSASYNDVSAVSLTGSAATGFSLCATCNHNHFANIATIGTSITTPISDSGTDNQLALSSVKAGATGSGTYDFSGATQVKLPVATGYTSAANGELGYDSTNLNWHIWDNGVDNFVPVFPVSTPPTTGNCVQWLKTGNVWTLSQAGGPCGTSSGSPCMTPITSTVAGSAASSITISSIPATCQTLVIDISVQNTTSNANVTTVQVNNDFSSHYWYSLVYGGTNAVNKASSAGLTTGAIIMAGMANATCANYLDQTTLTIQNYASTSFAKSWQNTESAYAGGCGSFDSRVWTGGTNQTAAISSIKVFPAGGDTFVVGSTVTVSGR